MTFERADEVACDAAACLKIDAMGLIPTPPATSKRLWFPENMQHLAMYEFSPTFIRKKLLKKISLVVGPTGSLVRLALKVENEKVTPKD